MSVNTRKSAQYLLPDHDAKTFCFALAFLFPSLFPRGGMPLRNRRSEKGGGRRGMVKLFSPPSIPPSPPPPPPRVINGLCERSRKWKIMFQPLLLYPPPPQSTLAQRSGGSHGRGRKTKNGFRDLHETKT